MTRERSTQNLLTFSSNILGEDYKKHQPNPKKKKLLGTERQTAHCKPQSPKPCKPTQLTTCQNRQMGLGDALAPRSAPRTPGASPRHRPPPSPAARRQSRGPPGARRARRAEPRGASGSPAGEPPPWLKRGGGGGEAL